MIALVSQRVTQRTQTMEKTEELTPGYVILWLFYRKAMLFLPLKVGETRDLYANAHLKFRGPSSSRAPDGD